MKFKLACMLIIGLIPFHLSATDPIKSEDNAPKNYAEDGIFYAAENKNILANPDFENGTSYWTLGKYNGATATFTADSISTEFNGKQAVIHTGGSLEMDYSDIQFFSFMEVSSNTIYNISFSASVKKTTLISVSIGNGIDIFYEEKLLLRPEKKHYGPFTFKADLDELFAFFALNLGRTNTKITVDEVLITADHTEKKFNEIIANSGINIEHIPNSNELYIQLPTSAKDDYPIIFTNEKGKTVKTDKIRTGSQELFINLQSSFERGNYIMKVFAADKTMSYSLSID